MKKAHFEFEEIPFSTLARFGLTQEMIEDLPMHVLDDIYNGRHSPVLPVRVTDEHRETVESRIRRSAFSLSIPLRDNTGAVPYQSVFICE